MRRADDNEAVLRRRLVTYHAQTSPLVDYYRKRNLHTRIDASLAPNLVYASIQAAFGAAKAQSAA